MIPEENRILAQKVAEKFTGRWVAIIWKRPELQNTVGLAEKSAGGHGGYIYMDPNNPGWIHTLLHEIGHLVKHYGTLPVRGDKTAVDWRDPDRGVAKVTYYYAEIREKQADEFADRLLDEARPYVPHFVGGRSPTKEQQDRYLLEALLKEIEAQ